MKSILKTSVVILGCIALVGCSIHSRHHYGHYHGYRGAHHSSVHLSGRSVAGALIAGAVIGYVIHEASHNHRDAHHRNHANGKAANQVPDTNYYLKTLEGECFWVQKDHQNIQRQTEVDPKYCEEEGS